MTDPIADMLTRIRNALIAKQERTVIPASKMKLAIAKILVDEGYLADYTHHPDDGPQGSITVELKYLEDGQPAIRHIQRASRPGLRQYVGKDEIPEVLSGLGISILTTSKGVMTGNEARRAGIGGEVVCTVY